MTTATALTDQTAQAMGAIARAETATGTRRPTAAQQRRAEAAQAKANDERAKKAALAKPTKDTKSSRSTRKSTPTRSTATTKKAAPKKTQASKAPAKKVAPKAQSVASQYAPDAVAAQLAEAVAGLRALGWTRPLLAETFGMTPSALWRVEHSKTRSEEVDVVKTGLTKIEKGEVALPERKTGGRTKGPSRDELLARVERLERVMVTLVEELKAEKAARVLADK